MTSITITRSRSILSNYSNYEKKQYLDAWGDVLEAQKLGYPDDPEFLESLKQAST